MEKKFSLSGKKCISKPRQSRKRPGCIRLFVCPTTGGRLEISVSPRESILGLKTALARKLKTNPARITLIYKEKALTSGRLVDYNIPEDSLLTLLPNMESGLSLHQSEKSITQALENLSETQVNDFLSGRAPLMLAIRMGESMVFVQLQLSTVTHGQGQPQTQGQASPQMQQRPSVTPMTQRTATLLSQRGLSASALAQATRCISRRIHHLQGNQCQIPRTTVPMATSPSLSSSSSQSSSSKPPQHPVTNPSTPLPTMMVTSPPSDISPNPTLPSSASPGPQSSSSKSSSSSSSSSTSSLSTLQLPTSSNHHPEGIPSTSSSQSSLPSPPPSPGAVMNSLKHVGSGVYSGTFSGTLDSSLQEPNGQPKRSVHTILHILNDLLVASPASPRPQPTSPITPSSPSTSQQHKGQPNQVFFNQNTILTPPPSPKQTEASGSFVMEDKADNELLRGKMQRVQMMLAQRKELRGKRRQATAPYPSQQGKAVAPTPTMDCFPTFSTNSTPRAMDTSVNSSQQGPSDISSSSAPSSVTAAPSTTPSAGSAPSDRPRICTHVEEGGKNGLDHDSLVV